MQRFSSLLFIALVFVGCIQKEQPDQTVTEAQPAGSTLGVPMPSEEILATLGPENNIPIYRLLPEPLFVTIGKPKQFLNSPISTDGQWLVSNVIVRMLQLYDIDPNSVEQVVQSIGIPMPVLVNVPNPQNPAAMPVPSQIQIPRRATIITFNTAVEKPLLIASILGVEIDPAILEGRKRTEGRNEYYDLTPPNLGIPQQVALGMIDERTAVIVEGVENDIKAVFSDAMPKSAVLARLKRTPIDTSDFTILTSLEGIDVNPEELENQLIQISNAGAIPASFVQVIKQHLRALTLSLNVSVAAEQPVISVYAESRNEEGAGIIGTTIRSVITNSQATLIAMSEDVKQTLLIPHDFALSLLTAISVDVNGTKVNVVLKNFESLIPTVNGWICSRQAEEQRAMLEQRRLEQLRMLAGLFAEYHKQNGKFPTDILDATGKPLLSWRIPLLPLMGLDELYGKFKLDEPWDSETNMAAMSELPMVFHPFVPEVALPKTVIRFFDSPGTPFANRDLKLEDVKYPHESLMFFVVSPTHAVEWTKPESLEFNADNIADTVGDMLLGVSFVGQPWRVPILPESDPEHVKRKQDIEALVKGTGLSSHEQEEQPQPPSPQPSSE